MGVASFGWAESIISYSTPSHQSTRIRTFPPHIPFGRGCYDAVSGDLFAFARTIFTLRLSGGGGSFPRPLKAEEEREYLRRWAQGDLEARNKLVEHNLRLVAHIVKKYYSQSGDQEDLISIGTIGLIKGISTFKSDKNVRLATYASRCIENAILS